MKFPRSQARDVTLAMKLVPTAVLGDGHVSEGHGLRQDGNKNRSGMGVTLRS